MPSDIDGSLLSLVSHAMNDISNVCLYSDSSNDYRHGHFLTPKNGEQEGQSSFERHYPRL